MEKIQQPAITKALEELFSYVPPEQLKRSLNGIFFSYLQGINNNSDLDHFKLVVEDFYFLLQFLEKVEDV